MKTQLLTVLIVVMWGQLQASTSRPQSVKVYPSELEKMQALAKRNIVSLGAEAAAKSSIKGTLNSISNIGNSVGSTVSAVANPVKTISNLGFREGKNIISPLINIGLKPVKQVYRAGKSVWLSNSKRAAKREIDKITPTKRLGKKANRLAKKAIEEKEKKEPSFSYTDKYYVDALTTKNKSGALTEATQLSKELYSAKLQAAEDVAKQASWGVRFFKRSQLKKAMKEAIQNTTAESIKSKAPQTATAKQDTGFGTLGE